MSAVTVTFQIESGDLTGYSDQYLAQLWHIAQANPAPYGDAAACRLVEHVGREIVRRWLAIQGPSLWTHQGAHAVQRRAEDDTLGAATLRQFREWLVASQPEAGMRASPALDARDVLCFLDGLAESLGYTTAPQVSA